SLPQSLCRIFAKAIRGSVWHEKPVLPCSPDAHGVAPALICGYLFSSIQPRGKDTAFVAFWLSTKKFTHLCARYTARQYHHMNTLFFSADYVLPVSSEAIKDGIVAVNDEGVIKGVYPSDSPDTIKSRVLRHQG